MSKPRNRLIKYMLKNSRVLGAVLIIFIFMVFLVYCSTGKNSTSAENGEQQVVDESGFVTWDNLEQQKLGVNDVYDIAVRSDVEVIVIDSTGNRIIFYPVKNEDEPAFQGSKPIVIAYPNNELFERDLLDWFYQESGVADKIEIKTIKTKSSSTGTWLFLIIFIIIIIFLLKRVRGSSGSTGTNSFTKSGAKVLNKEKKVKTRFKDVAGIPEAVESVEDIVDMLKNPQKYTSMGAKIPKGVLFFGPPGTWKTLLARATAGEANVPFFSISGSDFVELYVGVGASRVRSLFKEAKEAAPSIIFIDEVDAVGKTRSNISLPGNEEREGTLNALLNEMDGFEELKKPVIVIAATNRLDTLDPAFLRSGRFDRRISVEIPSDPRAREDILEVHAQGKPLAENVTLKDIAKSTLGLTGADLESILNEAALLAAKDDSKYIEQKHLNEARTRIIVGPQKKGRVIRKEEKLVVAHHEAGHAIVNTLLAHADPPVEASIVSRNQALGYVLSLPDEDRNIHSLYEFLDKITAACAGRAGEIVLGNKVPTTGARDDYMRAKDYALFAVIGAGMDSEFGKLVFSSLDEIPPELRQKAFGRVSTILQNADKEAREIIERYKQTWQRLAKELFEKESLNREEIETILHDIEFNSIKRDEDGNLIFN